VTTSITLNGIDRGGVIKRENVELMTCAYLGEVGRGSVVIDDTAGSISIPAYKAAAVLDDDSTPDDVFHGFTHAKQISRGESLRTGAARKYRVELVDGNDLLRRKVIRKTGDETGKRPAETVAERGEWLLASPFLPGVSDFGACEWPDDVGLDAADFRSQYAGDVLAAMAKACRMNFYVRWNPDEDGWELVFRDDNASTDDTCSLSISNDLADVDQDVVFPPYDDATLALDPEHVYSGALGAHSKGNVYEARAATATAFTDRDGITEDTGIRNAATASRDAETFLFESKDEEQLLPVTIRVPSSKVGLVRAGMRISTKMTHLTPEGWASGRYARILRLRGRQEVDDYYTLQMDLSPQEDGPPVPPQGFIVQRAFDRGGTSDGHLLTLPNPVTIGSVLVYMIAMRDDGTPSAPVSDGGAWTRLNGSTETSAEHGAGASGIAAYWKVADSTDNSFGRDVSNAWCSAVWELDGVDMTSATLVTKDDQTSSADPVSMALGSITPADGSICLMGHVLVNKADGTGFGDYRPLLASTVSSGWTQRFWNGCNDFTYGVHPAVTYPLASFADAGDDVTNATLTRPSGLANPNGVDIADDVSAPTAWAGIAIVVPPA
jgi:hypothetical protein